MKGRILVIDDEESIRYTFKSFLSDEGYDVSTARDYDEARRNITGNDFDVIFADIILGGRTGIDFLREVRERGLNCPVVMITGSPNLETASNAVRLGAFDYIPKPVTQETLLHVTGMAIRHKRLSDEKERFRSNLEAIFRSVREGIIMVDRELAVIEMNEAAPGICSFFDRDAIGKSLASLSGGCNGRCANAVKEAISRKMPVDVYRVECRNKQRQSIISLTVYPILDNIKDAHSGAVMVMRDETRLASLEKDLKERRQFHNIIGKSEKMQKIYSLIDDLSDVETTVLITGESGTGKELIADAIHYKGIRGDKPIVRVNCSALSESLLESELFGHVKGAFTGAIKDRTGRFQMADGGTIFLDEIGDISPSIQMKLLRVLQEKEFERVGDSAPIKADVRIIAATNKDIREKVRLGEFREDLFYRLKVVEINIPPLRERRDDIPLLTEHFFKSFNKKLNRSIIGVSSDVQGLFMSYPWHGNVRELRHALEHACIVCRQPVIAVEHLPSDLKEFNASDAYHIRATNGDEHQAIINALEKTAWNKAKAARLLGIDRKTLYRKIEKLKIDERMQ
ncbi:MAG: sigma 54-interacting transcriptional regulator [Nitrospirae bacterium]|nr:sigma 54-interacting transcriptional regulator [Nitrospirota bacterium]